MSKKTRREAAQDAGVSSGKYIAKAATKSIVKNVAIAAVAGSASVLTGGIGGIAILVGVGVLQGMAKSIPLAAWKLNAQHNFNKLPLLMGDLQPGDIVIIKDYSKASKLQAIRHPQQTRRAATGGEFFAHGIGIVEFMPPGGAPRISMSDGSHGHRVYCYDRSKPLLVFRLRDGFQSTVDALADELDRDYYRRKRNFTPNRKTRMTDAAAGAARKGKNAIMGTDDDDGYFSYDDNPSIRRSGATKYTPKDPAWFVLKVLRAAFKASSPRSMPDLLDLLDKGEGGVTIADVEAALFADDGAFFNFQGRVGEAVEGLLANMAVVATGDAFGAGGADSSSTGSGSGSGYSTSSSGSGSGSGTDTDDGSASSSA